MTEQEQREALIAEALTWCKTPFVHGAGVKGAGVDCAHLISEVLEAISLIPHVTYPVYGRDWFRHAEHEEKYIVETLRSLGLPQVEEEAAQMGDIGVCKFGRAYSHCVFLCGDGNGIQAWPTHAEVACVLLREERLWKSCNKIYFSPFKKA